MAKLKSGRRPRGSGDAEGLGVLSIGEIEDRYPDEWVLVKITATDEYDEPTHGVVVAHSPDDMDLVEPAKAFWREHPGEILFNHFTSVFKPVPEEEQVIVGRW